MGYLRRLEHEVTTDASGDATVTTQRFTGRVIEIGIDFGDLAGTTTVAVATDNTPSENVLTLAAGNTDAVYGGLKRPAVDGTDGSDITGAYSDIYVVDSALTITLAAGGDTNTGTFYILVEDFGLGGL